MVGRLSSILLAGPVLDAEEISLMCWLKSPLLIGGMDDEVSLYSDDSIYSDPNGAVSHGGNSRKIANSEGQETGKEIEVGLESNEGIEEPEDKEKEKEKIEDDDLIVTESVFGSSAVTKDFYAKVDVIEAEDEVLKLEEKGEVKAKEKRRPGEFPPSWSSGGRDRVIEIGGGTKGSEGDQNTFITFHLITNDRNYILIQSSSTLNLDFDISKYSFCLFKFVRIGVYNNTEGLSKRCSFCK